MLDQVASEVARAQQDAASYFHKPKTFSPKQVARSEAYAHAALDELERQQRAAPGVLHSLIEGGGVSARGLNLEDYHGLREVVQNADDLGASQVRFALRSHVGHLQLLVLHDGDPVELTDVLPMTYAFFSTKRDNPRKKGRFGVGLKTLGRIATAISIHCWPYSFAFVDGTTVRVPPALNIPEFYAGSESETLLVLELRDDFSEEAFLDWFEAWSASDLLFLNTVRALSLTDLREADKAWSHELRPTGLSETVSVVMEGAETTLSRQRLQAETCTFDRFSMILPVPAGIERLEKATAETTELSVAISSDGTFIGHLFLGLPTQVQTGLSFALDGQFDPATTREEITPSAWNEWLIQQAGALIAGALIIQAREGNPALWQAVPLDEAPTTASPWVAKRLGAAWAEAADLFGKAATVSVAGDQTALSNLARETEEAEGLVDEEDLARVTDAPPFPMHMRDEQGRWREVLDHLDLGRTVELADLVEAGGRGVFAAKAPVWFLDLASRIIRHADESPLTEHAWLPLADGSLLRPANAGEPGPLICLTLPSFTHPGDDLLRLAHPELGAEEPIAEAVRDWLEQETSFVIDPKPGDVLRAFAGSYSAEPRDATDQTLQDLRDLFERVSEKEADELGPLVGAALILDGFEFVRDSDRKSTRRAPVKVRPVEAYLPATIEDETFGWSKAAGEATGLRWLAPRYNDVLSMTRAARRGSRSTQTRGAKRFLMLLGAEIAPRLEEVDTPVVRPVPTSQKLRVSELGAGAGIIVDDRISPDLRLVAQDIAKEGSKAPGRRRTKGKRPKATPGRGVALFRCLAANWTRSYAGAATAMLHRDRRNRPFHSRLPSTWIAELADARWLENVVGEVSAPRNLIVPTRVTRVIYEGAEDFAAMLEEGDAATPLAQALGMRINPPASDILKEIEALRADDRDLDEARLLRLYRAFSGHCRSAGATGRIGDLSAAHVRGKFGIAANRPGLLHPVVAPKLKGWASPSATYLGRDIFHGRRPFVLRDPELAPLWAALNIGQPSISDCVEELKAASREPFDTLPSGLLIDVYRHLNELLPTADPRDRRRTRSIPLRCGSKWVTTRPVYVADHAGLAGQLPDMNIWDPPCAVETIAAFCAEAGIERLRFQEEPRVAEGVDFTVPEMRDQYVAALEILEADLGKDDETSYRSGDWDALLQSTLVVTGHGALHLRLEGSERRNLSVSAHATVEPARVYVESADVLGQVQEGGRAIARYFKPDRRRAVALAWVSAWNLAASGVRQKRLNLAGDETATADELNALHNKLSKKPGRKTTARKSSSAGGAATGANSGPPPPPPPPPRRLKAFPEAISFSASLNEAAEEGSAPGPRRKKRRPLPSDAPPPGAKQPAAPASARQAYSSEQLQADGWRYLELALGDEDDPLIDFQRVPGLGADGAINWKTFVELKAHGRGLPANESLTAAEFERARQAGPNYWLAVVTGLEEGFNTEIRVFANPLQTLPWTPSSSVLVSGLQSGRRLVIDVHGHAEVTEDGPE